MKRSQFLGVLMLDTEFPRPMGDLGNRNSFPGIPMRIAKVRGAFAKDVLASNAGVGLRNYFPEFLTKAKELQELGAIGITTSCGFLTPMQAWLKSELDIPVAVSSLLQVTWVEQLLPKGKHCAVITIDREALTQEHLAAVGVPRTATVLGMPKNGAFVELILGEDQFQRGSSSTFWVSVRRAQIERELIAVCKVLPADTGAIVFECTNLPPYRRALAAQVGLPIFDIQSLVQWFWTGLNPSAEIV